MDPKTRRPRSIKSTHTHNPSPTRPPVPIERFLNFVSIQARRFKEQGGDLREFEDLVLNAMHSGAAGLPVKPGLTKIQAPQKSAPQVIRSKAIGQPPARAANHFAKRVG